MSDKPDIFDRILSLPLLNRLQKHRDVLLYLFFGALTTVISIASFMLFDLITHELVANLISWICAVTFAYVTNRRWVFQSQAKGKHCLREMGAFFAGRLATLGLEEVLLLVFVTWLQFPGTFIKIGAQILVLILNYVISKLLVFRKK